MLRPGQRVLVGPVPADDAGRLGQLVAPVAQPATGGAGLTEEERRLLETRGGFLATVVSASGSTATVEVGGVRFAATNATPWTLSAGQSVVCVFAQGSTSEVFIVNRAVTATNGEGGAAPTWGPFRTAQPFPISPSPIIGQGQSGVLATVPAGVLHDTSAAVVSGTPGGTHTAYLLSVNQTVSFGQPPVPAGHTRQAGDYIAAGVAGGKYWAVDTTIDGSNMVHARFHRWDYAAGVWVLAADHTVGEQRDHTNTAAASGVRYVAWQVGLAASAAGHPHWVGQRLSYTRAAKPTNASYDDFTITYDVVRATLDPSTGTVSVAEVRAKTWLENDTLEFSSGETVTVGLAYRVPTLASGDAVHLYASYQLDATPDYYNGQESGSEYRIVDFAAGTSVSRVNPVVGFGDAHCPLGDGRTAEVYGSTLYVTSADGSRTSEQWAPSSGAGRPSSVLTLRHLGGTSYVMAGDFYPDTTTTRSAAAWVYDGSYASVVFNAGATSPYALACADTSARRVYVLPELATGWNRMDGIDY